MRHRLRGLGSDLRDLVQGSPQLRPPRWMDRSGSGDYVAVGRLFRGYFIEVGGLEPTHRVLDVGCGFGRMAVALSDYLRPPGEYHGFDVHRGGIRWCRRHIAARYPAFHFRHLDLVNREYNPRGRLAAAEVELPYASGSFDFAIATSVFTHLLPRDGLRMLAEIARVLRPGGTLFATFFLLRRDSLELIAAGRGDFPFAPTGDVYWTTEPEVPEKAVAYPEEVVLGELASAGLELARPVLYGAWCGREPYFDYQDIVVCRRQGRSRA